MSIRPPSPVGSTGMTNLTLGSALVAISLTAPVSRSATKADLLSGPMMSPLVLSRQPCITPLASHAFGNGGPGSGGGGGGSSLGGGAISGFVVNGWLWLSSNRAQPDPTSNAAHSSTSTPHFGRCRFMHARLRIWRQYAPRRRDGRHANGRGKGTRQSTIRR